MLCIRRREFATLLGVAATARPITAVAQQAAVPAIGFLHAGSPEGEANNLAAFFKGLSESGYVEGRNVAIEYRWGHNDSARLLELAAGLVARRVDVIATPGSSATALAAKAATSTIPIVFSTGDDPVQAGLVASLNKPGGNVTGFSSMNVELVLKRIGILRELVPKAVRFAVLVNPNLMTNTEFLIADAKAAASSLGGQVELFTASTPREIETAFTGIVQKRADAVVVGGGSPFTERRVQLSTLAAYHRLPAIFINRLYAEAGGLMSYGSPPEEQFREAGIYTGRILKGENPATLPVLRPTKFTLVINLQTARVLGIEVPPTLLALATEVIE
jgi:putative ABC transport system substrate-binding protein